MRTLKYLIAISIFCLYTGATAAVAQTTAFTYQGKLTDNLALANGPYHTIGVAFECKYLCCE